MPFYSIKKIKNVKSIFNGLTFIQKTTNNKQQTTYIQKTTNTMKNDNV
jgi:hypothetical protein